MSKLAAGHLDLHSGLSRKVDTAFLAELARGASAGADVVLTAQIGTAHTGLQTTSSVVTSQCCSRAWGCWRTSPAPTSTTAVDRVCGVSAQVRAASA